MTARRVALVSDWYLPRLGGIELQVRDLASALRMNGVAATVVTTTPGEARSGRMAEDDVVRLDVARLPLAGVAIAPSLVARLRDVLEAGGHQLVHAHASVVSPLAYAAILAARALDLPCVVTFHSMLHATARLLALADVLVRWRQWRILPTAVSGHVARQLERAVPGLDVAVLPNGVDRSAWRRTRREPADAVRVVSAMRLHRKKRPATLLDAFARALDSAPGSATLTVFGDGRERTRLERQLSRLGLDGAATLAGACPREQLALEYASADLFALPTSREAFGIAALEARCAGLPVLAMRESGVTEFLTHGHDALLARDDDEFASGLARLVRDHELRGRLRDAQDRTDAFDWPRVVARHLALYDRAADGAASVSMPEAVDALASRGDS